jgi:predicted nucleic acid-binding protein
MFEEDFAGRVWAFDAAAARAYAAIYAVRREAGRPIATMDLMIAAIARGAGGGGGDAGCGRVSGVWGGGG